MPDLSPEPPLLATVAICTRNRAESLRRTLDSIVEAAVRMTAPWELLVVDNGSTDHTPGVVEDFAGRLPIHHVPAPVAGVSNARNAAVEQARGKYLIFADDDVVVAPDWFEAYLKAFAGHPDAAILGGAAVPIYEEPADPWFVRQEPYLEGLLAKRFHPEWREVAPGRTPFSLNCAFRMAELSRYRFDPELGTAPGRRRGGEETAVILEMLADGARGVWIWDAKVHHMIPASRQTLAYINEHYRGQGYELPLVSMDRPGPKIAGLPVMLMAKLARSWISVQLRKATGRESWVRSQVNFAKGLGSIDRFREQSGRG